MVKAAGTAQDSSGTGMTIDHWLPRAVSTSRLQLAPSTVPASGHRGLIPVHYQVLHTMDSATVTGPSGSGRLLFIHISHS